MRGLVVSWAARGAGLAIGVGLVALLAMLAASSLQVIAIAFIAILLAAALEPFIGWVRAHTPIPRGPVILLVYLAFFALVALFAIFVLPAAFTQAEAVMRQLPSFLDEVEAWAGTVRPAALGEVIASLGDAARRALRLDAPETDEVVRIGLTLAEALTSIGAVLALVFFWLVGHARLQRYVLAFVPLDRRGGVRNAWNEVEGRLGMWFRGQLILMGTIGVLCGAAYFVLGVPSALLLGLIAAICEAIPLIGPILGAIPAVLAAATVSPELALVVIGVTALIQVVENNVLVPVIMRNTIGLSPLIVTLSLLVGAAAGGIAGALVAVPIAAAIEVILGRLQDREVPVAQDPGAVETPDAEETDRMERSMPDARRGAQSG
ncbi:MAG TPA: AI-2E family transporter [Candidatus Limnocylindrales bacterium]|nr:AI-2E family transporter [Candidatus Limnocylindrales bacterium]